MICRPCLDDLLKDDEKETGGLIREVAQWILACIGFLTTAFIFYVIGRILLSIPSKFHSGVFFE